MRDRPCTNSLIAFFLVITMIAVGNLACGKSDSNATNANSTATPAPTPDPCAAFTDDVVVDLILGQLIRDPDVFPEIKQISVTAKSGSVALYGWVSGKTLYDKVVSIANNTTCTKPPANVDNFFPERPTPGCAPPLEKCGDICAPPGGCAWSPKATPTPNANSKPNANATNSTTKGNMNVTASSDTKTNSNGKY